MSDQSLPDIALPSGWAKNVKSAVLHVISLAHYAIVATRGWAGNSLDARVRLAGMTSPRAVVRPASKALSNDQISRKMPIS